MEGLFERPGYKRGFWVVIGTATGLGLTMGLDGQGVWRETCWTCWTLSVADPLPDRYLLRGDFLIDILHVTVIEKPHPLNGMDDGVVSEWCQWECGRRFERLVITAI